MSTAELIRAISAIPGVMSVRPYGDRRHYINLENDGGNGDRNTKIWVEGSKITCQSGKGYPTTKFLKAKAALRDWAEAHGIVDQPYRDCPDWTAQVT